MSQQESTENMEFFFFFEHFEEKTLFKEAEEPTTREKRKRFYICSHICLCLVSSVITASLPDKDGQSLKAKKDLFQQKKMGNYVSRRGDRSREI